MEGERRAAIDAGGEFRVDGLEPGRWRVQVSSPAAVAREAHVEVKPEENPTRVVFVLGSGRVLGDLFDEHGRPIEGGLVTVESIGGPEEFFRAQVLTGPDGFYAVEDLRAGEYWHVAYPSGSFWKKERSQMRRFSLAEGETKEIEVGLARALAVWSGTVRNHAGDPVRGGGTVHLRARAEDGGGYRAFHLDGGGAFAQPLEAGTYEVGVEVADGRRFELGKISVPDVDLAEDLALPQGTRLSGRVRAIAAAGGAEPISPRLRISIRLEGHDYPAGIHGVRVGPDGSFVFDAVAPGRYRVDAWPHRIAGTPEGFLTVEVAPGVPEIPLDIEVEPR
jgi:hypothetical protein